MFMKKNINKVEFIDLSNSKIPFNKESFENFKKDVFEIYRLIVGYKMGLISIKKSLSLQIKFYCDSEIVSEINFNLDDFMNRDIEVNSDSVIPSKLIYSKKDFLKLNQKISYKLIEFWNLSKTFEELEFLLFNICQMIPIFEIELVEKSTMITFKLEEISNERCYQTIVGPYGNIIKEVSSKNFDILDSSNINKFNDYWHELISNDRSLNDDDECSIATLSEFLGCATLSNNHTRFDSKNLKSLPLGKILLAPLLINDFHKAIGKQSRFLSRCNDVKAHYGIDINKKTYKFDELLEKVYFHEVGHLYYAHLTNSLKPSPNGTKESFANSFASLVFDDQKKSLMIWLMTRYQVEAYKNPFLIKLPVEINKRENLSKKSNNLIFENICDLDLFLRPHGKS